MYLRKLNKGVNLAHAGFNRMGFASCHLFIVVRGRKKIHSISSAAYNCCQVIFHAIKRKRKQQSKETKLSSYSETGQKSEKSLRVCKLVVLSDVYNYKNKPRRIV